MPVVMCSAAVASWGSSVAEREAGYPCDALIDGPHSALFRSVDVSAPVDVVFRWLCQLRAAPYSYDWIDNLGRRSPRHLVPGLEQLEVGQTFMTMFRLVSFETGRSITVDSHTAMFGRVAGTYRVVSKDTEQSRLVVKLMFAPPSGPYGFALRHLLPAGDLVMMRKQLLTLKELAERDAVLSGR